MDTETNVPQEEIESTYRIVTFNSETFPQHFKNLIIGPMLNSLRYGNDLFKLSDKNDYYLNYGKFVESLLKRPKIVIKLAMLRDETVLGWSLTENLTVHYVWVKEHQRRNGIAKSLVPKSFDTISHITNKALSIWVSKFPEVRFNPWA